MQPGLLGDVREFNRCGALRLLPMMMMMYVSQLEHCREFSNVIEQRNAKDASESDRLRGQQRLQFGRVSRKRNRCAEPFE